MRFLAILMLSLLPLTSFAKTRLAIANFKNKSGDSRCAIRWFSGDDLGSGMADQLVTELSKNDRFDIQERENLKEIYSDEHELINADKSAAPKKNQFKAAHFSIVGSVTAFEMCADGLGGKVDVGSLIGFKDSGLKVGAKRANAKVVIDVRVVDVEKGKVIKSWSSEGKASSTSFDVDGDYKGAGFGSDAFNNTPVGEATRLAMADIVKKIEKTVPQVKDAAPVVSADTPARGTSNAPAKMAPAPAARKISKASETKINSSVVCADDSAFSMCKPVQKTQTGKFQVLYLKDGSEKILSPNQVKELAPAGRPKLAQSVYVPCEALNGYCKKEFVACKVADLSEDSASVICDSRDLMVPLEQIYTLKDYQWRSTASQ
jgi:curli biogenesis system outer membrane secretion channel CsgG